MEDELKPLLPKSLNFVLLQLIILSLGVGLLESCSWVTSRRSLFGDDPKIEKEKKAKELKAKNEAFKKQGKSTEVPREEYEQLKNKYESLLNGDYDKSKLSDKPISQEEMGDVKDPAQLVEQLKTAPEVRSGSSGELAETVDVFGKNGIVRNSNTPSGPTSNALQKHETDFVSDSIESEITKLREAEGLIELNKFNEGLNKLKVVENSTSRQVRVRAKFLLGEILFKQKEYDLAMQVFEEIISKDAFSGLVLKSLGRLIVCCEKLKQEKKQQQYYSILHDFFESGA
ncbi:MAG: tetratricopeptide (TPR) repeat protein [Bacteriovoracaceae bacterium]|jgi:tetratricopeptide (TPR) repeat protein